MYPYGRAMHLKNLVCAITLYSLLSAVKYLVIVSEIHYNPDVFSSKWWHTLAYCVIWRCTSEKVAAFLAGLLCSKSRFRNLRVIFKMKCGFQAGSSHLICISSSLFEIDPLMFTELSNCWLKGLNLGFQRFCSVP